MVTPLTLKMSVELDDLTLVDESVYIEPYSVNVVVFATGSCVYVYEPTHAML